jgi:hypothetical protein
MGNARDRKNPPSLATSMR